MSTLQAIQQAFQDYLLHGNREVCESIVNAKQMSAEKRLAIYGYAYRSRLVDALASHFPILNTYLGDDAFEALAHDYMNTYPSTFRSIRWFGGQLPLFLKDDADDKQDLFLSELAQFEWYLSLAFDAEDSHVLTIEDVAKLPPEAWITMRLNAQASVHRLDLYSNAVAIWQALTDEKTPPTPCYSPEKTAWIIWRHQLMTHFSSVTPDEAWAIDALQNGSTFNAICEGLCQWHTEDSAATRAASLLKSWIQAGLIAHLVL